MHVQYGMWSSWLVIAILSGHHLIYATDSLLLNIWPQPQSASIDADLAVAIDVAEMEWSCADGTPAPTCSPYLRRAFTRWQEDLNGEGSTNSISKASRSASGAAMSASGAAKSAASAAKSAPEVTRINLGIVLIVDPSANTLIGGDDETYSLAISKTGIAVKAATQFAVLRALSTLRQMMFRAEEAEDFLLPCGNVTDWPRFGHRHFIPMDLMLANLDAMEVNKLNVLHWHIVDDPSFPYESSIFPNLSLEGSYSSSAVYSQKDVQRLIHAAYERGIRVMFEIDTPGHTLSWGKAMPGILSPCYDAQVQYDAQGLPTLDKGPLDPTKAETYQAVDSILSEVAMLSSEKLLHLGGDEVDFTCWQSDATMAVWMVQQGLDSYKAVQSYYIDKILETTKSLHRTAVVWQEVYDSALERGLSLDTSTIVQTPPLVPPVVAPTRHVFSPASGPVQIHGPLPQGSEFPMRQTSPLVDACPQPSSVFLGASGFPGFSPG
eukprot:gene20685-27480_t